MSLMRKWIVTLMMGAALWGDLALFAEDTWYVEVPPTSAPAPAPAPAGPGLSAGSAGGASASTQPSASGRGGGGEAKGLGAGIVARAKQREQFLRIAPNFSRAYIRFGDDYAYMPAYNPLYPSNLGDKVDQGPTGVKKLYSREEIDAILMPLQDVQVGQYGHIHSFRVERVTGPDEMVVSEVWLIDSEALTKEIEAAYEPLERKAKEMGEANDALKLAQAAKNEATVRAANATEGGAEPISRADAANAAKIEALPSMKALIGMAQREVEGMFVGRRAAVRKQQSGAFAGPLRVKGFSTAGIKEGERWYGTRGAGATFKVAVVRPVGMKKTLAVSSPGGKDAVESGAGGGKPALILLVPAEFCKTSLTVEQFAEMLAKFGATPDSFVELAVAAMRADSKNSRDVIFTRLENYCEAWETRNSASGGGGKPSSGGE
jgi:hypothetical protein